MRLEISPREFSLAISRKVSGLDKAQQSCKIMMLIRVHSKMGSGMALVFACLTQAAFIGESGGKESLMGKACFILAGMRFLKASLRKDSL